MYQHVYIITFGGDGRNPGAKLCIPVEIMYLFYTT